MDVLRKYSIPYKSLETGTHHFDFKVDDRFFEAFDGSEIHRGNADVRVTLDKQPHMLTLRFDIRGEAGVECDRCLGEFMMPVRYDGTLHVRFSATEKESDGEVMWLSPAETELDLAQYIYESICLSLPYQRVHPDDANGRSTCDPDMLSRFRIVSEEEFGRLAGRAEAPSPWDKLNELKTGK